MLTRCKHKTDDTMAGIRFDLLRLQTLNQVQYWIDSGIKIGIQYNLWFGVWLRIKDPINTILRKMDLC